MASKSAQQEPEKAEVIEEALDVLDQSLDRVKVLYEQYFLGIQKQAPSFLHTDVERKLRDLSQMQIRNTALRYRLTTLQQKFGAYSGYWRRTIKQIENGTYARSLSKVGRKAVRTGEAVPEEILAAMPKRMREQVVRDREVALAVASRRGEFEDEAGTTPFIGDDVIAMISEPTDLRRNLQPNVHELEDVDIDLNEFFAEVERQTPASESAPEPVNVTFKSGGTPQLFGGDAGKSAGPRPAEPAKPERSALETAATVWGTAVVPEPGRAPTVPVRSPADLVPEPGRAPTVPVRAPDLAAAAWAGTATPTRPNAAVPREATPTTPTSTLPRDATPTAPTAAVPRAAQRTPVAPLAARPAPTTVPAPSADESGPRAMPAVPPIPKLPAIPTAPSQLTKPNPIAPGASAARGATPVETMAGPFPRTGPRPGVPEPIGTEPSATTRAAGDASTRVSTNPGVGAVPRGSSPGAATRGATNPSGPAPNPGAARGSTNPGGSASTNPGATRATTHPGAPGAPTNPGASASTNPSASASTNPSTTRASTNPGAPGASTNPGATRMDPNAATRGSTNPGASASTNPGATRGPTNPGAPGASTNPGATRLDPNAATRASTNPGRPDSTAASREPSAAARSAMIAPAARAPTPPRPAAAAPADIDAGWGDSDSTSPRVAGPRPEAPQTPDPRSQPRPEAPRPRVERKPRPAADAPRLSPPPGMTDADVNALFANYVKAKEMVGESAGPGSYGKLLKTINAQAPKIMQQYNAKGVDFSIVVKDNQVIIRAKPKT